MDFKEKPVIGMIHLVHDSMDIALSELHIYEKCGLDGAIIENYHGSYSGVEKTLERASRLDFNLSIGVNILPNEFEKAFELASRFNADFIQLDHVAGQYIQGCLDYNSFIPLRKKLPEIKVLGGVWPKYYQPIESSCLEKDLLKGIERADAIVVTGSGTGIATPLEKVKQFRRILGDFPLIVGAGLNSENAYEQLCIADGAIVGSCFKEQNRTERPLVREKIEKFMSEVKRAREFKLNS